MNKQIPLLEAKKIRKTFCDPTPVEILQDVDLTVAHGETVAILGRSGSGKSTLLQILGTLDNPTEGSLFFQGAPFNRWKIPFLRNHEIGFVFQSFHLLEDDTALENVLMPAKIARKSTHATSSAYERACRLLTKVGLSERAHLPAKWLSGGEKQRVSLARAMMNEPKILFADEPSGNLDGETSAIIHRLLLDFAKESFAALVIVTHDPALSRMCQKQYLLKDGVLQPAHE